MNKPRLLQVTPLTGHASFICALFYLQLYTYAPCRLTTLISLPPLYSLPTPYKSHSHVNYLFISFVDS